MPLNQAFILGIIQGLTEFIPVSSSGHLVLVPEIFGWVPHSTSFDIILHAGTLFALLVYFRNKLAHILKGLFKGKRDDLALSNKILVASIPALIVGLIIKGIDEIFDGKADRFIKDSYVIVFMLLGVGILLIAGDYYFKHNRLNTKKIGNKSALKIGLGQCLAFLRGTSRSGITIFSGLTQGLTYHSAAEFSFLMGIPVITASVVFEFIQLAFDSSTSIDIEAASVGFIASFVSGLIAISFMLNYLSKKGLKVFGLYRIVLGIAVIVLVL